MRRSNPYYAETVWLSYKHRVLNHIASVHIQGGRIELSEDQTRIVETYWSMIETMAIYDDLVAAAASPAILDALHKDFEAKRFANKPDPVNACRRAYSLPLIERKDDAGRK